MKPKYTFPTLDELLKDSQPCSILTDFKPEIVEDKRQQEIWSEIGSRVVGAE
jgi:hypothetical protein